MNTSFYEIYKSISLTMSITLVWLGLQNLVAVATRDSSGLLLRRQIFLSILGVGCTHPYSYAVYHIPPPLLMLTGLVVLFIRSWLRQGQFHY